MKVVECTEKSEWDAYVQKHGGHPLQLWGWGEVKASHGWSCQRYFIYDDDIVILAAQVLVRSLPWPFRSLAYIPRGPIVRDNSPFHVKSNALSALSFHVKTGIHPVLLKIEPDVENVQLEGKWKHSSQTIQAPKTIQLDLRLSEEELQNAMTKKTRQYIRKSSQLVVIVELNPEQDFDDIFAVYKETSLRAHFPLHEASYYKSVASELGSNNKIYGAKIGKELVAFLWLATTEQTAFELYGGVIPIGQDARANYALKWHAIEQMKKQGVTIYDFGGLIGTGVSTFKKGWSNNETHLVGALDLPLSPLYIVWARIFPLGKRLVRLVRKQ